MIPDEWVMDDWALPKSYEDAQEIFKTMPTTLEQVLSFIKSNIPEAKLVEWAKQPKEQALSVAHFSLGMWIRNSLVHGYGSPFSKELEKSGLHPDDISSIVLDVLWDDLNGIKQPLEYYIHDKTYFNDFKLTWDDL